MHMFAKGSFCGNLETLESATDFATKTTPVLYSMHKYMWFNKHSNKLVHHDLRGK